MNAVKWMGPTHTDVDLSGKLELMNMLWNKIEEEKDYAR